MMTLSAGQVKALLAQLAAMQAALAAISQQLEEVRAVVERLL